MFYELSGEMFKEVLRVAGGAWLVSYENPGEPWFVNTDGMKELSRIEPPESYRKHMERKPTDGQKRRLALIEPLLGNEAYITDQDARRRKADEIAREAGCTRKRVQRLFFKHLAGHPLVVERETAPAPETEEQKTFAWAIQTYYYSAKKMSLRTVYDLMLLARYTDADGHLMEEHPSWHQFRHYFYGRDYHRRAKNRIARDGLSSYQRNKRPLFGSASGWKDRIGAYQMDETQADIYLVSRLDKSAVVGRPNIYLAVDTATQLVAGIYVGLDAGEQAVVACLANAAMDKVEYCRKYGIGITKDQWPSAGLPGEVITDKGKEFTGSRMHELAMRFGMEFQSLPPFRPDGKGLVEKCFDLIQQKYKPLLRGKGVIEEDARERWAVDYRSQAVLTLEDFTKIVIHCVLYLNSCRILEGCPAKAREAAPVPARLWDWYEEQGESSIIPIDREQLYLLGLPRKGVTLQRKGISSQGLWYVSNHYKTLVERVPVGSKVEIAYDPEDVSRVYMVDGMEYVPFELAGYQKQYIGATETECRMERDKRKAQKKELERMETEGRLKVLQSIQEIVGKTGQLEKGRLDSAAIQKNREREAI